MVAARRSLTVCTVGVNGWSNGGSSIARVHCVATGRQVCPPSSFRYRLKRDVKRVLMRVGGARGKAWRVGRLKVLSTVDEVAVCTTCEGAPRARVLGFGSMYMHFKRVTKGAKRRRGGRH